ncbi:hypothetical protein L873DRAFT_1816770 [Choiromyces venosus 120613-1]|uniref:Hydrophobin n=1 Tax=Choiromyces venosus 120613-1 TaxID=1336337 RepID=A0A3N4JGP7_9PEZI|nr:hypothetical protein L873DRAFT_1816770 [Choiromyces venosus 120613-1]
MQFKVLTLLTTLVAVAAAGAIPGRGGSAEDKAINDFTEKCKGSGQSVICCNKTSSSVSKGALTGNLNGGDVACNSVPSYVLAGTLAQTQAQCGGGLGCCTSEAVESRIVSGCSGFAV